MTKTQHLIASTMTALALVGGTGIVFADGKNVPAHGYIQDDGEDDEPRHTPRPREDDDDEPKPTAVVPEPTTPPLPSATPEPTAAPTSVPTAEPTITPTQAPKPSETPVVASESNVEEEPVSLPIEPRRGSPTFATVPPVIVYLPEAPTVPAGIPSPQPRTDLPANIQLPKTGN